MDTKLKQKRILTGDRPTGKMHIGHYFGTLRNRVELQNTGEYEQYLAMANIHALSDNRENPEKIKNGILELLRDYHAVGIDFDKTTVYIQSEVPETHEIFMYLANFASVQQLEQNPTLKQEIKDNGMEKSIPLGFYLYPIHQTADILCVNADLVPVGKDQAPMVEASADLADKFNATYKCNVLSHPKPLYGTLKNVPGYDGNVKMGKSLGNGIYLGDTEEELLNKIKKTKTDHERLSATAPGNPENSVVFKYLELLINVDDNISTDMYNTLVDEYKKGVLSDSKSKEILFEYMNKFLEPIRERRIIAETMDQQLLEYAIEGSKKIKNIARGVADQMKEAMLIKF